jgi:hypothetical protein
MPEAKIEPTAAPADLVPYEPPAIVWEQPFPTTVFGVSCAKVEGLPRCSVGPLFA